MVKTYNESVFFNNLKDGSSFQPSNYGYILIVKGTLELDLNDVVQTYRQGDIVIISPSIVYKLIHYSENLKSILISIDPAQLKQRINLNFNRYEAYRIVNAEKNKNLIKLNELDFEHLLQLSKQLDYHLNQTEHPLFKADILLNLLSAIIYIIAGELLQINLSTTERNSRKEEITMHFIELVALHYKAEKELQFYADKLAISVKYLSNSVRNITLAPPTRFLAANLINEAKILLLNSNLTISMIADELGFSDQYAFGKFFKKHTGLSPRNFKQQNFLIDTI